jgi:hypothetical protein
MCASGCAANGGVEEGDEVAAVLRDRPGAREPLVGQQVRPPDGVEHARQVPSGLDADQ